MGWGFFRRHHQSKKEAYGHTWSTRIVHFSLSPSIEVLSCEQSKDVGWVREVEVRVEEGRKERKNCCRQKSLPRSQFSEGKKEGLGATHAPEEEVKRKERSPDDPLCTSRNGLMLLLLSKEGMSEVNAQWNGAKRSDFCTILDSCSSFFSRWSPFSCIRSATVETVRRLSSLTQWKRGSLWWSWVCIKGLKIHFLCPSP